MSAEYLAAICITRLETAAAAAFAANRSSNAADNNGACCLLIWLCRSESLEAQLKSLLYYFRHHTVEPEILKRLCFVEIVYMLQNHANRCGTVPVVIFPSVLFAAVHACCTTGVLRAQCDDAIDSCSSQFCLASSPESKKARSNGCDMLQWLCIIMMGRFTLASVGIHTCTYERNLL